MSRLERELSQQQVAISRVRTQLVEAEGSNKQLLLRVRYLEDQLVKVRYGDSGRVELVIVGWCITVCTILQEHSAHSNLQQHYTSSQQLVQQLQVSVVTMVTCMLAPPTPSWQQQPRRRLVVSVVRNSIITLWRSVLGYASSVPLTTPTILGYCQVGLY